MLYLSSADYFKTKYGLVGTVDALLIGGRYKYLAGQFTEYEAASKFKNDIINQGVTGAFLVAYLNGESITLAEAREVEQK